MNQKNTRYLLIALLVIGCTMLGALGGAVTGGVAGYLAGRRAARSIYPSGIEIRTGPEERFHFEIPAPEMPKPPFEWRPRAPGFAGGALIKQIVEGAPDDDAGLREGDLITHVDGKRVTPVRDLATLVREHKPGDTIELAVERDSEKLTIELTLGEHPDEEGKPYMGIYYETVSPVASRSRGARTSLAPCMPNRVSFFPLRSPVGGSGLLPTAPGTPLPHLASSASPRGARFRSC